MGHACSASMGLMTVDEAKEMKMLILSMIFTILTQGEASSGMMRLEDIYHTFTNSLNGGSSSTAVPPVQLSVKYFTQAVSAGNVISPYDAVFPPYITYEAGTDALYTLAAVDPDTPSYSSSYDKEYIHILIVNIPGSNISAGDSIVRYIAPNPQPGSGYHRFMFLLYKQKDHIDVETNHFVTLARKLTNFSIVAFAKEYNLGDPVAVNFFRSQHIICEEDNRQQQCS